MILAGANWENFVAAFFAIQITGAIYFGLWCSVLVHEIGHIVGAHIGRLRIYEVSFGKTTRFVGTIRKIRMRLAWTPLPGLVRALPTNTRRYRIRMLVFIACGPLFTAGYELFLVWLVNQRVREFDGSSQVFLWIALAMNSLILLSVLVPETVKISGGTIGTDMLQIWRLLTKPLPKPGAHFRQFAFAQASYAAAQGRQKIAARWVRKLTGIPADDLPIEEQHTLSAYFVGLEEWEAACRIAERVLAVSELVKDDPMRWESADIFASAVLYGEDREAMPRAIELLEEIVAEFPSIITLKGTLGGLLFELGRIDEAEATLKEVIAKSTAAIDQGISSAYLARIAEQRGSTEEARKFAEAATKHSGEMAVVKRILAGSRT